ncbi:MAG: DUF4824 family protein [Pirellulales bacterium]|nr:DUF4824 family protein [Pirellulales bacterium]
MRRGLILTAVAVVLATNVWTLIAAWRNRSDPSGGAMELTERELHLVHVPWESTVTLLELRWDVLSDTLEDQGPPAWLDATKLAELGYDCTVPIRSANAKEHYSSMSSVLVFLVLEYDGEAWRQACRDRKPKTRLFVVDAGRDAFHLRNRYPNTKTHVITRGVVRLSYQERSIPDGAPLAMPRLQGWIENILPSQIFVPRPHGKVLEVFRHSDPSRVEPPEEKPRYVVKVSWGTNYEPWVHGVRRLTVGSLDSEAQHSKTPNGGRSAEE